MGQKSQKILCHNVTSVREIVFSDAVDNLNTLFGFETEDSLDSSLPKMDDMHLALLTVVIQKFLNTHSWYMADFFSTKEGFQKKPEQLLSSSALLLTLVDTNYCYSGSALGQV